MAMKIGGRYRPDHVYIRHWHRLVPDTETSRKNLEKQLLTTARDCLEQSFILKDTLEEAGIKSAVFVKICSIIKENAEIIEKMTVSP